MTANAQRWIVVFSMAVLTALAGHVFGWYARGDILLVTVALCLFGKASILVPPWLNALISRHKGGIFLPDQ